MKNFHFGVKTSYGQYFFYSKQHMYRRKYFKSMFYCDFSMLMKRFLSSILPVWFFLSFTLQPIIMVWLPMHLYVFYHVKTSINPDFDSILSFKKVFVMFLVAFFEFKCLKLKLRIGPESPRLCRLGQLLWFVFDWLGLICFEYLVWMSNCW